MQINITQFVLVKIPRNMGFFRDVDSSHLLATGIRAKLLTNIEEDKDFDEKLKNTMEGGDGPKLSLGQLLRKLKESQR